MNYKFKLLLLSAVLSSAFADTALNSLQTSTASNTQPTKNQAPAILPNQSAALLGKSSASQPKAKPTPKKKKKIIKKKVVKSPTSNQSWFKTHQFDFDYTGDVKDLPSELKKYDKNLTVLPSIGRARNISVNLELADTSLSSIIDTVKLSTNSQATLDYDSSDNSIRVVYASKLNVAKSAVEQSKLWQNGGTPDPILSRDGVVLFPYGTYQTQITCQPLQLCDIHLQAGERINSIRIGDTVRWNEGDGGIVPIYSGEGMSLTPHIVLKPSYAGLNTTLLITTQKRTYHMKLLSSNDGYVARVGFYYPGEVINQQDQMKQAATQSQYQIQPIQPVDTIPGSALKLDISKLSYNYSISGSKSLSFYPTQVFDDGSHVYIQMPEVLSSDELPAFYVLAPDGETYQLVNFSYKKPYYIVDKMFKEGVLLLGIDDNKQEIKITHKPAPKGFWSSVFGD